METLYNITRERGKEYKVQFYDTNTMAWKDIQHRHATLEAAQHVGIEVAEANGVKTRIMEIDNNTGKRRPL